MTVLSVTCARFRIAMLIGMATLLQQACGDGTGVTPAPLPERLEILSGDHQSSRAGSELAAPLRVRVLDSENGPLGGVSVQWSLAQGQATLSPVRSTTNANGEAETQVTLGPTVGPLAVSATVRDLMPVLFSITALDPSPTLHFTSLQADYHHSCGITATGTYCWGPNDYGELGDGTTSQRVTPVPVVDGQTFATIVTGVVHTCGFTPIGAAHCWGFNGAGEVGDGTTTQRVAPVPVASDLRFAQLSAGFGTTCGVTAAAAAYCWGYNVNGQLGDGATTSRLTPVAVAGGVGFSSISVGGMGGALAFLEGQHTCALTAGGTAYCWGYNGYGRLGDGTATSQLTPVPVAGGLSFTSVSAGANHTCGLASGGATYCWGDNYFGQGGDGTGNNHWTPTLVAGDLRLTSISAGGNHTCGLATDGTPFCWGGNVYGQLGDGSTTQRLAPVPVAGNLSFTAISAGGYHTCAVTAAGDAYCWGHNGEGRLGDGTTTDRHTPTRVVE
jgi:alpha-tubulin suppressor-like RCC1 family protein